MTTAKKTTTGPKPATAPDLVAEPELTDPRTGATFTLVRDDTGHPVGIETAATR